MRSNTPRSQQGMTTAEYAVGTVAACAFGCLLLQLLMDWQSMLLHILGLITEAFDGPMQRVPR